LVEAIAVIISIRVIIVYKITSKVANKVVNMVEAIIIMVCIEVNFATLQAETFAVTLGVAKVAVVDCLRSFT